MEDVEVEFSLRICPRCTHTLIDTLAECPSCNFPVPFSLRSTTFEMQLPLQPFDTWPHLDLLPSLYDMFVGSEDSDRVEVDVSFDDLTSVLQHVCPNPNPTANCDLVVLAKETTCAVCLDPMTGALQLPCGHTFHAACIKPWLQSHTTCPTCRFDLEDNATCSHTDRRSWGTIADPPHQR